MKVGDLVKVAHRGRHVIDVITSVKKRRNSTGTHDEFIKVLGCGNGFYHQLNVKVISEARSKSAAAIGDALYPIDEAV